MTSLLLWKSLLHDRGAEKSKKLRAYGDVTDLRAETNKKLCEDVNNLCRICDEENGIIPLYNNKVHPNLTEEIYNISGVRMDPCDDLSNYICQNCLNLFNGCIMFREMCRKSNNMIFEMNIMRERNVKPVYCNCTEFNDIDHQAEWDSLYNVPSPNYSEKNTKTSWTFDKSTDLKFSNKRRRLQRRTKKRARDNIACLCYVCGKIVTSIHQHMSTHTGVFPYKCNKCPYRGGSKELLKTHNRTHLSKAELPFRCTKCPTAMSTASNLSKHMRTMHGQLRRTRNLNNKPFKCDLCERTFVYKADMKRHIIMTHENAKHGTIECEICLNQFSTKHILLEHQINVHKLKRKAKGLGRIPAYLKAQLE